MNKQLLLTLIAVLMAHPLAAMNLDQEFRYQCSTGDLEQVRQLLANGADVHTRNLNDETGLMLAAKCSSFPICELLIAAGADINAQTRFGGNPLFYVIGAYLSGMHTSQETNIVCALLINAGADVNIQNNSRQTALMETAQAGSLEKCRLLLNAGAKLNLMDHNRNTALHYAARAQYKIDRKTYGGPRIAGLEYPQEIHEQICRMMVEPSLQTNSEIITALLCFNRIRNENPCAQLLYRQFRGLLLPHLGTYTPLRQLLSIRNVDGNKRAYDYLPIDCLNPDYNPIARVLPNQPAAEQQAETNSKCSIQ